MALEIDGRLRFTKRLGLFLLLLFALPTASAAEETTLQKLEPRQPLGTASTPEHPPEERKSAYPEAVEPTEELTLADAIALALVRSPDLAGFAWEVRAQEARILQAGLLPNPTLSALVENLGTQRDDITGGVETTIQLGQLVELGGKRLARKQVATLGLDLAEWTYEIKRLDLLRRVSRSFIGVLGAQKRVVLAEEIVQLAEQSAGAVSARVEAGKVSPVEEIKANVALSTARIGFGRTQRELESSRKVLSATWGSSEPRFKLAAGDFDTFLAFPDVQKLTQLLSENSVLSRAAAEVSFRQAEVNLAKSVRVPDVTIGGGVRRYEALGESTHTVLVGISIPLPLFDRKQGEVLAARSEVERAVERRRATEVRLQVTLAESYQLLTAAYSEITALRNTVLPGAQKAFEAVNEGYRLGRFGLLDVLDSQRTLFEARRQYLRVAEDYHKAVVDVERLIGVPLDSAMPIQDGDLP